jgi:ABC-type glycerol-3-phosphate transport system substrate-binding protein
MKRMKVAWILVILLAVPLIAFAGGGAEKSAAPSGMSELKPNPGEPMDQYTVRIAKELAKGKDVTLRVMLTWDAPGEALIKVIPEWEAATGIKVKSEKLSTLELSQKVNLELSSGTPEYDIIQYDKYIYKPILENPNLLNLDPYMKKYDPHFETMMTGMGEWGKADDGTNRMLPFYWCTYTMVYRKDLFENPKEQAAFQKKYGYKLDVNNLTFDKSYKDAADFFTRDTDGDGNIDMWGAAEMLAAYCAGDTFFGRYLNYWNNDKPYLSDAKAGKANFNDAAARALIKDMLEMQKRGSFIPEMLQTDWASILGVFGSGRAAMALQYTPSWVPLQSVSSEFKYSGPEKAGFAHIPGVTGKPRSTISSGWLSFITKNSPIPEISYLFLLWASSEKIDREMAMTTLHNPVRQATYKDPAVLKLNPSFVPEAEHIEGQYGVPAHMIYEEEQLILSNAMQAIATGQLSVDAALAQAEKEINAKWAEVK